MASRGDRTARGPGCTTPGSTAPAAAPADTSASTPAGGSASHGGAVQPGRAPAAADEDEYELRGLVQKLLVKVTLRRHGRAAELAEQAAELAALMLRLGAGTLLPGAVREEELLFYSRYILAAAVAQGDPVPNDALLRVASSAVGYDVLLEAALLSLLLLSVTLSWPAAEGQRAQLVVLSALDAIQATVGLQFASGAELSLANFFQQDFAAAADAGCFNTAFHASVLAKWTNPAVVDTLRLHGSLQACAAIAQQAGAAEAARKMADVAARGFRTCGLPSFGKREATVRHFKLCGGCDAVAYCCDEHHGVHWREGHRRECRHLRAAGAKPPSTADAA